MPDARRAGITRLTAETFAGNRAARQVLRSLGGLSDDYSRLSGVSFKGVSFGASDVNVFIGVGTPDFSLPLSGQEGLVGFGLQNVDLGLGVFEADLGPIPTQKFQSLTIHADEIGSYGFGDIMTIRASDVTLEVNIGGKLFGGVMRSTADYSSIKTTDANGIEHTGFEIRTGGDPVRLNFKGNDLLGLDIGLAEIAAADFLFLRGSLAFRQGEVYDVAIDTGFLRPLLESLGLNGDSLPLQVQGMTLGGANLTGFAGISGTYRFGDDANGDGLLDNISENAVGLVIDDVDFGLAIMTRCHGHLARHIAIVVQARASPPSLWAHARRSWHSATRAHARADAWS